MRKVLWTIPVVLLVAWLIGFIADVGGLIHFLLLLVGVILIMNVLTDRRFL